MTGDDMTSSSVSESFDSQNTSSSATDDVKGASVAQDTESPDNVQTLPLDDDAMDAFDEEMDEAPDTEPVVSPFMQNRELSWLTFNERVLDQGADESVPLLERLNFISIFWSNLQEFFMVRVGSLTDLSYVDPPVHDSKTNMTPQEQILAIHKRCHELYPIHESTYERVRGQLAKQGVKHIRINDLSEEQLAYLSGYAEQNIRLFLAPQVVNSRHPFPHLENGKLYIVVRLDETKTPDGKKKPKKSKEEKKLAEQGCDDTLLGLIPLPHQCERVIKLPGKGFQFILLEHVIEMMAPEIFSMYHVKHTNVICVTRNADVDANVGFDEADEDWREHMKRVVKSRARLAPVRLESERPLSPKMSEILLERLNLEPYQVYDTTVPLDLSFTWDLGSYLPEKQQARLSNKPFTSQWPASIDRSKPLIDQIDDRGLLMCYPYETVDVFVQLLREAAADPTVMSIKITLYRLARHSSIAEALISAAEAGKDVTALFELRARFDESNNIEWSQRFEEAGCNVIYGFRDFKVHSKICCITRQRDDGIQCITQLGTGNYNEKTAHLYTDFSYITSDPAFGRDALLFFRNMSLENLSDKYETLSVAPLQIKPLILEKLEEQAELARAQKPCSVFIKTNSVTDKDIIEKIAEVSQVGVPVVMLVRGICCLLPGVRGYTDNVRVVSIVGRLLEHNRIFCFGVEGQCSMYLSSADLMTRNMEKRIEIAWPVLGDSLQSQVMEYIDTCLLDTAKLREMRSDGSYTPVGTFVECDDDGVAHPFDSQNYLIEHAAKLYHESSISRIAERAESNASGMTAKTTMSTIPAIPISEVVGASVGERKSANPPVDESECVPKPVATSAGTKVAVDEPAHESVTTPMAEPVAQPVSDAVQAAETAPAAKPVEDTASKDEPIAIPTSIPTSKYEYETAAVSTPEPSREPEPEPEPKAVPTPKTLNEQEPAAPASQKPEASTESARVQQVSSANIVPAAPASSAQKNEKINVPMVLLGILARFLDR